jgi:hypothetical protein
MLDLPYDYASCVRSSEKVSWKLDDVMPPGTRLDFTRPFLPATLATRGDLPFLSPPELLKLNQITAHAYLNLFGFVEEYIIAVAVNHAHAEKFGDRDAIRALVRFADEEVKHQAMFKRYVEAFERDFGHACAVLGSAAAVANVILSKSAIAVMLVTLHLEIMTQAHYVECVKDDQDIDPLFAKLLRFHWMEEAQHARIDTLELEKLLGTARPGKIREAIDDYLGLIGAFDGLLKAQAEMDAISIANATRRTFETPEIERIVGAQHRGYRHTFLVYGMTNTTFLENLAKISKEAVARVAHKALELA